MTTTERAARVLQEIDAALALAEKAQVGPWIWDGEDLWHKGTGYETSDPHLYTGINKDDRLAKSGSFHANATFIAASRTGWPKTLRCLKMSIEGWQKASEVWSTTADALAARQFAITQLTAICELWEAK